MLGDFWQKKFGNINVKLSNLISDQVQSKANKHYSLILWRKNHREVNFEERTVKLSDWLTNSIKQVHTDDVIVDKSDSDVQFSFLLLKGVYRVHFKSCDPTNNTALLSDVEATLSDFEATLSDVEATLPDLECDVANEIVSDAIRVDETSNLVDEESWCFGSKDFVENSIRRDPPKVEQVCTFFRTQG